MPQAIFKVITITAYMVLVGCLANTGDKALIITKLQLKHDY